MPIFKRSGFSTYYEVKGSGDPIVFICGLSVDSQLWRLQAPELSKTHRVITFDNRGAGRSDAPDEPYTILQMAGDLAALLDHLSIDSAHVAGSSMGGVIAQSLALAHPERIAHLLLLGTFAAPDGYVSAAISNWVNMRRSNMPYEHIIRHVARMVYSPALANNPEAYETVIQMTLANPHRQKDHAFFRQAGALLSYRAPPNLAALRPPATILVGEHDQLTPLYLSEQLAAILPGATMQVLAGAHLGFLEYPEPWTAAIRSALDRVSRTQ